MKTRVTRFIARYQCTVKQLCKLWRKFDQIDLDNRDKYASTSVFDSARGLTHLAIATPERSLLKENLQSDSTFAMARICYFDLRGKNSERPRINYRNKLFHATRKIRSPRVHACT